MRNMCVHIISARKMTIYEDSVLVDALFPREFFLTSGAFDPAKQTPSPAQVAGIWVYGRMTRLAILPTQTDLRRYPVAGRAYQIYSFRLEACQVTTTIQYYQTETPPSKYVGRVLKELSSHRRGVTLGLLEECASRLFRHTFDAASSQRLFG